MKLSLKIKILILILPVCAAQITCTRKHGIIHRIEPQSRHDTEVLEDGRGLIRSIYCDIYAEALTPDQWEELLKNRIFINEKSGVHAYRVPRLMFFHVTLKNTSDRPVRVENIRLKYGSEVLDTMSPGDIQALMKSPLYSSLNFDKILITRKLITGPAPINKIRYDRDTIILRLPFIPPSDTIDRIVAFRMVPVKARKLVLVFTLQTPSGKKIIDFDFNRREYRTRGKLYRNKDRKGIRSWI